MPIYILDVCPENLDESNVDSIIKLWLQFIPIFGALHSQLRKGHTSKKDISMFLIYLASPKKGITKKDIFMLRKRFLSPIILKRSARGSFAKMLQIFYIFQGERGLLSFTTG